jgi:hypothetical protein
MVKERDVVEGVVTQVEVLYFSVFHGDLRSHTNSFLGQKHTSLVSNARHTERQPLLLCWHGVKNSREPTSCYRSAWLC